MIEGCGGLWAKGRAVGNAKRFPRQAARCPKGIVHKSTARFWVQRRCVACCSLGIHEPADKLMARSGSCSSEARTVVGAHELA